MGKVATTSTCFQAPIYGCDDTVIVIVPTNTMYTYMKTEGYLNSLQFFRCQLLIAEGSLVLRFVFA